MQQAVKESTAASVPAPPLARLRDDSTAGVIRPRWPRAGSALGQPLPAPSAPGQWLPLERRREVSLTPAAWGRTFRCVAFGVTTFFALTFLWLQRYQPPLPSPLALSLELDSGQAGQADPILVSGRAGAGDFLVVRYRDEASVEFRYDSWGHPPVVSTAVPIPPGRRFQLQIESPALRHIEGAWPAGSPRLRVICDGAIVLDAAPHFHVRQPGEIFFAENPLGGTACGPTLHGRLRRAEGRADARELRGNAPYFRRWDERAAAWLRHERWQPGALLALTGVVTYGWIQARRQGRAGRARVAAAAGRAVAGHRWFAGTVAVSGVVFAGMVTQGGFRWGAPEPFGDFYDYQAASLLQGRLDVPEEAIGGEAFVAGGKLYGYFGPTPALLRLPWVVFHVGFGRLTRAFMLVYFLGSLTASYLLLRHATKVCLGPGATPSPGSVVILVGGAGLGSSLFFLGSRAFTYHEAILAGATFALFSIWCALRHLAAPGGRWWIGALACGLLALHARAPAGLFALTFLGAVAVGLTLQQRGRGWRRTLLLAAGCTAAVLSFNGLAYLKFKTFDGAPLHLSRPYDAARLAKIEGRSFHASNLPFNAYTYLLRPNFRVESRFPWLYLGSGVAGIFFPAARTDLADETLALPWAMPGLFALATLGCGWAFWRQPAARWPIAITWAAAAPMTLALFAAVATAHRYTADFCPFLIGAAAFGLAAAEPLTGRARAVVMTLLGITTLWACLLGVAMTLHYQRDSIWGVPEDVRQDYQHFRQRVDNFLGRASR